MKKLFFLLVVYSFALSTIMNAQETGVSSTETMDPKAANYYNEAIQFMKAEQYENALKSIDSSLMITKNYKTYYLQGQAYFKLGNTTDAVKSFEECVKLNPDYDMGWFAEGNANLILKKLRK